MNADLEARVGKLEETVRNLTDQVELLRLMASYAPAVDSGADEIAARLWVADGVYDVDVGSWTGLGAISEMVRGAAHRAITTGGGAHVISSPHLVVSGDSAVATCYSRLYVRAGDGYKVWRVAANRWEFVRGAEGWRIKRRVNRLLDGSAEPRALLRAAFPA